MQQLTMTSGREIEWWDVPPPVLGGGGEAIVRPIAVALCDLDQPILLGEAPIPGPIALGHEFVAEVVEVGEQVQVFSPGQRVVVPFQISCGACRRCRAGLTGNCEEVSPRSMYGFGAFGGDWGGALSDLVRVPFADAMLLAAPEGVPAAAIASASDNIPDGWRTVAPHLQQRAGAEVLILGGGGRSIALYASGRGACARRGQGGVCRTDPERLAVASAFGAETIETPDHTYGQFPITVDASGTHEGLHRGAALHRASRHLHEHRHLLRAAHSPAAAGDVHHRGHVHHWARHGTRGYAGGSPTRGRRRAAP